MVSVCRREERIMSGISASDPGPAGDQELIGRLFSPEGRADPYSLYHGSTLPGCRHAVASRMLKDPRIGPPQLGMEDSDQLMWRTFSRWLLNLDGERHQAMRQRFGRVFARGRVERYRPLIEARAHKLIDAVADAGEMDLVTDFARPLPFAIVTSVLGVPEDRQPWLAERMHILDVGFARQQDQDAVAATSAAIGEMLDYFGDLLDQRARTPEDDLMSTLAADPPADDEGRADLLANCVFFINAGHITTTSLITGGLLLLVVHPDALARLVRSPDLIPDAVEEMLRMVTPVSLVMCRARRDVEIDGYHVLAGQRRVVFTAGANRDPEAFAEPDTFDVGRSPNPHLAFSAGAHFCLGAPLARLHGQVAIRVLLDRLPDVHLAGEPEWLGSFPLRVPEHLPIGWGRTG
jgi:cytochrome P450